MSSRPRALDLFCCAGGMSVGLERAGFDVVGVDINPQPHHRGGEFVQADAMETLKDRDFLRTFDFIHASPPCQGYSSLRHLAPGKEYPKLIEAVRFHLERSGVPWSIENVPGAPLRGFVTLLCGTMFGLMTPDGRAEIRRHRLFETSFSIPLRPACQHGHVGLESLSACGTGMGPGNKGKEAAVKSKRRALTVAGGSPEMKLEGYKGDGADTVTRETFSIRDAQAAMGLEVPMKYLSQAVPPVYGEWIGREALAYLEWSARAAS